jgi:hypothetical protein
MNDQTDNNKGFLKDKLGDYQVHPPEKVWDSISDKLGGGRNRKGMLILVLAAAASLALAVSLGIYYFGPDLPREIGIAEEGKPLDDRASGPSEETLPALVETLVQPAEPENNKPEGHPPGESTAGQESTTGQESTAGRTSTAVQANAENRANPTNQEFVLDAQPDNSKIPTEDVEPEADPENPEDPEPSQIIPEEQDPPLNEVLPEFQESPKRDPRWMVGAVVSPLYSFRDAKAHVMAGAGVHETGMLSYSSGVHVNYRGRSRLAIETGIFFNKTGLHIGAGGIQLFNQQSDYLLFGAGSERTGIKAVTNSVGNIISNSGEIYVNGYKLNAANAPEAIMDDALNNLGSATAGIEQHLDYLELPFNLRYTVIDRSFEVQLVGGVSTNFLINNYVTMETRAGQEEIGYLSNIRNVNYSGNAGLGMIYHVGKNLNLMVEPRFRYFLNSINDSSLPATRPYSFGLYTSLNFTF